jgi:hypothetical protein
MLMFAGAALMLIGVILFLVGFMRVSHRLGF